MKRFRMRDLVLTAAGSAVLAVWGLVAPALAQSRPEARLFRVADQIRIEPEDWAPADHYGHRPGLGGGLLHDLIRPPFEIARGLAVDGFELLGRPIRRGWVYVAAAISPQGDSGRAIVDARTGRVIRFFPTDEADDPVVGSASAAALPPPIPANVRTLKPPLPVPNVVGRTAPLAVDPDKARAERQPEAGETDMGRAWPRPSAMRSPDKALAKPPVAARTAATTPQRHVAAAQAVTGPAARAAEAPPLQVSPPVTLQPTGDLPPVQGFE